MFMKAAPPATEPSAYPPAHTPSSRVPPVPSAPPTARGLPPSHEVSPSGITLPKSKPQLSLDVDDPEILAEEDTVDVESLNLPVSNPPRSAN
jgi:hypothetical protein